MPRFVLLEHDYPGQHWDLMLESGNCLRTWRLDSAPQPGHRLAAQPLADHRLAYLDYEGPVSGNRGRVRRFDSGTFNWLEETSERLLVELRGTRLLGVARLARDEALRWTLSFDPIPPPDA